jgi:hypothetical protein
MTAVVAKAATITGMRGTSAKMPDSIGATPWTVVGPHSGELSPGSWEKYVYSFPLYCYLERTADDARTQAILNDLLDAFIIAYRSGISLGGTVAQTLVRSWNTDRYTEISTSKFQILELTVETTVVGGQTYTA